jgi:hypothetical protein
MDFPSNPLGDIVYRRQQCILAGELPIRVFQLAATLDIDVVKPVDHDLGHRVVVEQGPDRLEEIPQTGLEDGLT